MKRINFVSLRKCDDLYNYQSNVFEFENGIIDEVGAFYPMPIKARDLIIQGHYFKPISEYKPEKLTKFNYQSYYEGVKTGYNELLPKDNSDVLEIAATDIILKYTQVDRVCSNSDAYDFGVAVGRLYHAWVYIADNVNEFARAWKIMLNDYNSQFNTFADLLNVSDEDKKALIDIIKLLLVDAKGLRVANLLYCLEAETLLKFRIDDRIKNKVYDIIRNEFSLEFTNESVNKQIRAIEGYNPKTQRKAILIEKDLKHIKEAIK